MTKNEKVISDRELDMVVGGASALLLKKRADGKIDSLFVAVGGDVKAMEKLFINGEVSKIQHGKLKAAVGTGLPAEKLDAFINWHKKRHPDLEVKWVE